MSARWTSPRSVRAAGGRVAAGRLDGNFALEGRRMVRPLLRPLSTNIAAAGSPRRSPRLAVVQRKFNLPSVDWR